jgi:hypothetical protein
MKHKGNEQKKWCHRLDKLRSSIARKYSITTTVKTEFKITPKKCNFYILLQETDPG